MSETSSVRGVDEAVPASETTSRVSPPSRRSVVSVESGGEGPPHSRFRGSRGTPGGFLVSRGLIWFFCDADLSSSDLCVCRGDTRSTSSRSSSLGDPATPALPGGRGDCEGVFPSDELAELPSRERFVWNAVPALEAEPGTRKFTSRFWFRCFEPRPCVGGLGVASPRRSRRRCDRSVSARCVNPAPFIARYEPAPNAAPIMSAAPACPSTTPALFTSAVFASPVLSFASRSASAAAREARFSRARCCGVIARISRRRCSSSSFRLASRSDAAALAFASRNAASSFFRASSFAAAALSSASLFLRVSASRRARSARAASSLATRAFAAKAFFSSKAANAARRAESRRASSSRRVRSAFKAASSASLRRSTPTASVSTAHSSATRAASASASRDSFSSSAPRFSRSRASAARSATTAVSTSSRLRRARVAASACCMAKALRFASRSFVSRAKSASYARMDAVSERSASSSCFSRRARASSRARRAARASSRAFRRTTSTSSALGPFLPPTPLSVVRTSFEMVFSASLLRRSSSAENKDSALARSSRNLRFARSTSWCFTARSSSRWIFSSSSARVSASRALAASRSA